MAHEREAFLGAWQLVDWRIEYADGRITHPFGERPQGRLLYTDEAMSVAVCSSRRAPLACANPRDARDSTKARAFDSYFHYAGVWQVDGDYVIHDVEIALNPDMIGVQQRRLATFDGAGRLTLSAHESGDAGAPRLHVLQWRR